MTQRKVNVKKRKEIQGSLGIDWHVITRKTFFVRSFAKCCAFEDGGRRLLRFAFVDSFALVETKKVALGLAYWWKDLNEFLSYQNKLVSLLTFHVLINSTDTSVEALNKDSIVVVYKDRSSCDPKWRSRVRLIQTGVTSHHNLPNFWSTDKENCTRLEGLVFCKVHDYHKLRFYL